MPRTVQLQEAFKLALSLVLFYWLALAMDLDLPKYGALAIVLVSLGTTGASLNKGILRIVGTTVGLVVGLVGLAFFAQDRLSMLLFLSAYLVVIGYGMQSSRYPYAWFVAGFLPPLVWSTTYGAVDNAFHYAVFRYLETTAGIIIYTVISALLWPRRAGAALDQQGTALWSGVRSLFDLVRRELDDGRRSADATALRTKLAGEHATLGATLGAAFADTPTVAARKHVWRLLPVDLRALGNAIDLWREGIEDCPRRELERALPSLDTALDTVARRLARIERLWTARVSGTPAEGTDEALLVPLALDVDPGARRGDSAFDRAALLGCVRQLQVLDVTSRELLRTMRALAGLDTERSLADRAVPADLYRPSRWDPARLVKSFCPALCFVLAFVFWILFDPPTGPAVPNMASTLGLVLLLTPMSGVNLLVVMLGVMWIMVAPIYLFVMPHLATGPQLLALIFVYTIVVSVLFGKRPLVKTMALVLFVMMTGISNSQVYSFMGLVNGGFSILLALVIIVVVQVMISPARPERVLLRGLGRFFRGCAGIVGTYGDAAARAPATRKRLFQSMVMPVPSQLRAAREKLDEAGLPDEQAEHVEGLLNAMQALVIRLQAIELTHARAVRHAGAWTDALRPMGRELRDRLQRIFQHWSRFDLGAALDERAALQALARNLERTLDTGPDAVGTTPVDDGTLADVYAFLGSTRGLVRAVVEAHENASRINWSRLTEARF